MYGFLRSKICILRCRVEEEGKGQGRGHKQEVGEMETRDERQETQDEELEGGEEQRVKMELE